MIVQFSIYKKTENNKRICYDIKETKESKKKLQHKTELHCIVRSQNNLLLN